MAAISVLNAAINDRCTLSVNPEFCKRIRFRRSDCRKCVEVCPENAISLNPGPIIKESCSNCGFCRNVCPTELFRNGPDTDERLIDQMGAIEGKKRLQSETKQLFIRCHNAENQNDLSLQIRCLGSITENTILGAAVSGFDGLILVKGNCSRCHLKQGEKLMTDSIKASLVLLESMGVDDFPVRLEEKEKRFGETLSRREIFSRISRGARERIASCFLPEEKTLLEKSREKTGSKQRNRIGIKRSARRECLREVLGRNERKSAAKVCHRPEFRWGVIKIEAQSCSACGLCQRICPTGAISRKLEERHELLLFNGSLCTNCSLCKEVCPRKAITFEENVLLADIVEDVFRVAAKIKVNSCVLCGDAVPEGRGELCSPCQNRQLQPVCSHP